MRSYKLDEFVAHTGAITCLKIGRKSSGVLVTGGQDKKVNVWAIGKPTAILSLTGHQSSVECVNFDTQEEVVAAGGQNGSVKIWDLNATKSVRTLTGHRSSCLAIEFHPFGDFLATGSLDTNLKVWDLRRKDCIQTYKGHLKGITHVGFSPDGRWVASGCEAGEIKLWELSTGRLLHDFKSHDNRVTGLQFHPQEFLLTTASADRTVCTWDLETWDLIETLGPEPQPVRAIHYHPDGRELLVATQDGVKVWGIEPARHYDTVPVQWGKVADVSIYEHRLIGCSYAGSSVGVYVVDLKRVAPFSQSVGGAAAPGEAAGQAAAAAAAAAPVQLPVAAAVGVAAAAQVSAAQVPLAAGRQQLGSGSVAVQAAQVVDGRQRQQQQQAEQQQRSGRGAGAGALSRNSSDRSIDQREQQQGKALKQQQQQHSTGDRDRDATIGAAATVAAAAAAPAAGGRLQRQVMPPGDLPGRASANSSASSSRSSSSLAPIAGGAPALISRQVACASTSVGDSLGGAPPPTKAGPLRAFAEEQQRLRDAATSTGGLAPAPDSDMGGSCVQAVRSVADAGAAAAFLDGGELSKGPPTALASAAVAASAGGDCSHPPQQQQQQLHEQSHSSFFPHAAAHEEAYAAGAHPHGAWGNKSSFALPPPAPRSGLPHSSASTRFNYGSSAGGTGVHHPAPAPNSNLASAPPSAPPVAAAPPTPPAAAQVDPLIAAAAYRPGLRSDLSRALSTLQVARGFVSRGNMEGAYRAAAQAGDAAAAAMLFEALQARKDAFEVSSTEALVRALEVCLAAGPEHEHAAGVALSVLSLVLRGPGQAIRETLGASCMGVDLSFEARRDKCIVAKLALQGLGMKLGVLARSGVGAVAVRAQQVAAELQALGE